MKRESQGRESREGVSREGVSREGVKGGSRSINCALFVPKCVIVCGNIVNEQFSEICRSCLIEGKLVMIRLGCMGKL